MRPPHRLQPVCGADVDGPRALHGMRPKGRAALGNPQFGKNRSGSAPHNVESGAFATPSLHDGGAPGKAGEDRERERGCGAPSVWLNERSICGQQTQIGTASIMNKIALSLGVIALVWAVAAIALNYARGRGVDYFHIIAIIGLPAFVISLAKRGSRDGKYA